MMRYRSERAVEYASKRVCGAPRVHCPEKEKRKRKENTRNDIDGHKIRNRKRAIRSLKGEEQVEVSPNMDAWCIGRM